MKFKYFSIILFFIISALLTNSINAKFISTPDDSIYLKKKGGVCFRFDDNAPIADYMRAARLFAKYNANFCMSLNFSMFSSQQYIDSIRVLQDMGNEIMDHTPNHRTNFFITQFPINDYLRPETTIPIDGIDHIQNNKICLEFETIDTSNAVKSGVCDIFQNELISSNNFTELAESEIFVYIPILNRIVLIDSVSFNKIFFLDIWNDKLILPTTWQTKYFIFDQNDIQISENALKLLANETTKLANLFNINPPNVWIQPGGKFPQFTKTKLGNILGNELNYVAGAAENKGRQIYNELDPNKNEKFEMQWGDFFDDTWTVEKCKNIIADRTAKHYMQISHAHFYAIDSIEHYFSKLDSLLSWLTENNIPIKTYSQWAKYLYEETPDPYVNIFPSLSTDLDKNISDLDTNGVPDGYTQRYWSGQGNLINDTTITSADKFAYSISTNSRICRVENLAGIEKGKNDFKIYTKGNPGDSIEVVFSFGEYSKTNDAVFKFPADSKDWVEYSIEQSSNGNTSLIIPENVNFITIDIFCSNYVSGEVRITGMYLAKSRTSETQTQVDKIPNYYALNQNFPNPFNPETKISYSIAENSNVTLKVYNILGSEIATLVNKKQNSGNYEVSFNAVNISSGIYFYTLQSGNYTQTKKMVLVK